MDDQEAITAARLEASIATAGLSPTAPSTWRLYLAYFVATRGGERPEDIPELRQIQERIKALAEGQTVPKA